MLSFFEARDRILANMTDIDRESVSLPEASGRVIAEDIVAPWPMPQWDNSAMDGFAVRSADCPPPCDLKVDGFIPAGGTGELPLKPGSAVRIMTGAPIPEGADTVIPVEDVEEREGAIRISAPVKPRQHIRYREEDVRAGERVIRSGCLLRPAEIGLLASFGKTSVRVFRRVRVAIVSTGDELVEPGTIPARGQIINSNTYALAAALRETGAEPVIIGIARDNIESHRKLFAAGLEADALITSAGVSAGDRDLVREVLNEFGVEQLFWKINIRPGRPTAFGLKGKTPVFSLPGNPVATLITFDELVRPALLKMMGHKSIFRPLFKARLNEDVKKKKGRLQFLRVAIEERDGVPWVSASGDQHTGIVKSLVRADAIAYLPAERNILHAGDEVDVHLI